MTSSTSNNVKASFSKRFVEYVNSNPHSYPDTESFFTALKSWPEKAVRANTHVVSIEDLCTSWMIDGDLVPWCSDATYFDFDHKIGASKEHKQGLCYVGDPSAMVAVECVDIKSDAVVVDMCAAPGGKSIHALNSLGPSGTLISNDVDSRRVRVLKENLDRMMNPIALEQRPHCEITNISAQDLSVTYRHQADVVLLDAPCSGEAIMRKSDIARRQWSPKLVAKMSALQKELFDSARELVKPGGMIIYSTCTFNSCENYEVIAYAREELNLTPARGQELVKHLEEKTAVSLEGIIERDHGIVLYPHYIRGDGQSVAVLTTPS